VVGDRAEGGAKRPTDAQLDEVGRIAELVREVLDARASLVSRVVDDTWLEVVAVAGTPSREGAVGDRWLRSDLETLLADAERRGGLHLTLRRAVSYVEVSDHTPDPGLLGLLVAPLRTAQFALVGVLAVEGPVDVLDPEPGVSERVELYADQMRLVLEGLQERQVLAERLRLTDAAQSVLDGAGRAEDMETLLATVATGLAGMLRASACLTCAEVTPGVHPEAASYPAAVSDVLGPDICTLLEPLVDQCRRERTTLTHESSPLLLRLAQVTGHDCALLAAVDTADDARGALLLLRHADLPAWSSDESEALVAFAERLGTVITHLQERLRDHEVATELRDLDQYRRDLIASITHDLKAPLTAISLNAELLESDRRLSEAGGHPVAAIRRSAARLSNLVDDLLTLARAEEGGLTRQPEAGDVSEIVREACRQVETEARARGITFAVDMPEHLTGHVDLAALARVYANVVSNAVKFSLPDGEVRLTLRHEADAVELVCADDGIGIPPEDQEAVFDMFRRSRAAQVRGLPGTGVGLAISQRIVDRLGGTIRVESTPGKGSTFTVRVPAGTAADG
jgi:signal transduction histidine kinase